jgi:hypothetical protein
MIGVASAAKYGLSLRIGSMRKSLDERITIRVSARLKAILERGATNDRRDLAAKIRIILEDWVGEKERPTSD